MLEFLLWWFENVSQPIDDFVGQDLPIYTLVAFIVITVTLVFWFSQNKKKQFFGNIGSFCVFRYSRFCIWFLVYHVYANLYFGVLCSHCACLDMPTYL